MHAETVIVQNYSGICALLAQSYIESWNDSFLAWLAIHGTHDTSLFFSDMGPAASPLPSIHSPLLLPSFGR